jgi:hypothetical protein
VPLSCAAVLGIRSRAMRKTIEFKMTAILQWAGAHGFYSHEWFPGGNGQDWNIFLRVGNRSVAILALSKQPSAPASSERGSN